MGVVYDTGMGGAITVLTTRSANQRDSRRG